VDGQLTRRTRRISDTCRIRRGATVRGVEVLGLESDETLHGERVVTGPEQGLHLLRGDRVPRLQAVDPGEARADPLPRRLATLGVVARQAGVALLGVARGS